MKKEVMNPSLYKTVFDKSIDGVLAADLKTKKFVFANPQLCRITGYPLNKLLKLSVDRIHPRKDLPYVLEQFKKQAQKKITLAKDIPVLRKDKKIIYCDVNSSLIKIGKQKLMLGLFRDVTERKKAEEKLRESEDNFKNLFENMSSGVAIYKAVDNGKDFIFTNFNKASEKIENIKRENVIGKSVLKVFPGIKKFGLFEIFQRVWKTGKPEHYPISFYKDKRLAGWRENYVYKLPSGRIVAIYDDITERKKAEEALKESEDKFKTISSSARDAIIMIDNEGKISYWNYAAEKLFGYTSKEILGKNLHKVIAPQRYIKAYARGFKKFQVTGNGDAVGKTLELNALKKDGTEFPVELSMSSVKIKGKWNAIGIIRDITERKKAEEEIKKSEEKFHSLYSSMNEGVYLHEVIYNKSGKAVDYRILDANPISESILGIKRERAIGNKATEIYKTGKPPYLDIYAKVAASGKPTKFKTYFPKMKKHFSISVFSPGKGKFATVFEDITEQKKAEEEIQSQAKFPSENPHPVMRISKDGILLYANKAALALGGKLKIGKPIEEKWRKTSKKTYEDNQITEQELPVGKKLYLFTIVPIKGAGYMNVYGRDITERKKTESILQKKEELLRATLESTDDGILVVDEHGGVTYTNAQFAKMWKIPKEIIQTMDDRKLIKYVLSQLKEPQEFLSKIKKLYKTPKESLDIITFKDDRVFERFSCPLIQKGKVIGRVWNFRDVTERKKAERAIQESEERYRATFESTGTAMMVIEKDTTISLANHQLELLTGYSKEEIEGKKSWTEFIHKKDLEMMKKYHKERRKPKGNAPKQYEFRLIDKNKNVKNIFLTVDLISGTKKSVASLMDITERKQIEQEIKKRNEELEKFNKIAVGRELRMVELKKKIKKLEEKEQTRK